MVKIVNSVLCVCVFTMKKELMGLQTKDEGKVRSGSYERLWKGRREGQSSCRQVHTHTDTVPGSLHPFLLLTPVSRYR